MGFSDATGNKGHRTRKGGCRRGAWLAFAATLLTSSAAWADNEPGEGEEQAAESNQAAPETQLPEGEAPPEEAPSAPSGPHTANSLQLSLGFRYGVMLSDGEPNPWGTGLGLDVGYTLPSAIYLGASFEYFFGGSSQALDLSVTSNIWQLSAESGYDLGLGENFVIRPKLAFGVAGFKSSVDGCPVELSCEGSSATKAAIAPGVTLMLFTQHFSLAVDTRYDIVLIDPSLRGLIFSVGVGF